MVWSPPSAGRQIGAPVDPPPDMDDFVNPNPAGPVPPLVMEDAGLNRAGAYVATRMPLPRGQWVTIRSVDRAARAADGTMMIRAKVQYEQERVTGRVFQALRLIESSGNVLASIGDADELLLSSESVGGDDEIVAEPIALDALFSPGDAAEHTYSVQAYISNPVIWVGSESANNAFAWTPGGDRVPRRDIYFDDETVPGSVAAGGAIVCDGSTFWYLKVTNNSDDEMRAFRAQGASPREPLGNTSSYHMRDRDRDINIGDGNGAWRGGFILGTTLYMLHSPISGTGAQLRAFSTSTGERMSGLDIDLIDGVYRSAVSDGETIWAVNDTNNEAVAYRANTRARRSAYDIDLPALTPPARIWWGAAYDGTRLWFLDSEHGQGQSFLRAWIASTRTRDAASDIGTLGASSHVSATSDASQVYASVGTHLIVEEL